jgi:hypothetical protein
MNAKELEKAAQSYRWQDILEPSGIVYASTVFFNEVEWTIWKSEELLNECLFATHDESPIIMSADAIGPIRPIGTKFDMIRKLHFPHRPELAGGFIGNVQPIEFDVIDEIAMARHENHLAALLESHPTELLHSNPELRASVARGVISGLAKELSNKRLAEILNHDSNETPTAVLLPELLAKTFENPDFLVEGLIPTDGMVTVVAAKKTGKSTFVLDLIHSLRSGESFLGVFETRKITRRIGYVNCELTEQLLQNWLSRSTLIPDDQVAIWNNRGFPNPFRDEESRKKFAEEVRELDIEVLILDPFSGIFTGDDTNNNDQVKAFMKMLDAFKLAANVSVIIVPVHAGRDTSRSRGASSLDDHPDAILYIDQDSDGTRIFRAIGRDVEVAPGELVFEPSTLRLTYTGADRSASRVARLSEPMLKLIKDNPGITAGVLTKKFGRSKSDAQECREHLISTGAIRETSVGVSKVYHFLEERLPSAIAFAPSIEGANSKEASGSETGV